MTRALSAGMTDYSHQSLDTILQDLNGWITALREARSYLEDNKKKLVDSGYWTDANEDFKSMFARSFLFCETAHTEIEEIQNEIPIEVQPHHVSRTKRIGSTAVEINHEWGEVWHQYVRPKQYGNPNFVILENLYARSRDMAIDMMDLTNPADRLQDFVGRKKIAFRELQSKISPSSVSERKLRVFLCYASQDKVEVRQLNERLQSERWIDPWLDEEKIKPGQAWEFEIERAVNETDVVIVSLSRQSITKEGYIQKEIKKH